MARGEATNRSQATAGLVTGIIAIVIGGLFTAVGVVYFFSEGTTEIVVRAVDTSGNASGPSNVVTFACSL